MHTRNPQGISALIPALIIGLFFCNRGGRAAGSGNNAMALWRYIP
ncbi:MAG: hypothetical protein U9P80_03480 [Thermodesulfobacteriota bacterium]|nr:hypothetical protein [Thermodesulfobacteriota bacterium]